MKSLWDIIFGTAWRPAADEVPSTGLDDGDKPKTAWDGIVGPFRTLFRSNAWPRRIDERGA